MIYLPGRFDAMMQAVVLLLQQWWYTPPWLIMILFSSSLPGLVHPFTNIDTPKHQPLIYNFVETVRNQEIFFFFILNNFYSFCDLRRIAWIAYNKICKNYEKIGQNRKLSPNLGLNSDSFEIFGEVYVHMSTLTICYFKKLSKKPQLVLFSKNLYCKDLRN